MQGGPLAMILLDTQRSRMDLILPTMKSVQWRPDCSCTPCKGSHPSSLKTGASVKGVRCKQGRCPSLVMERQYHLSRILGYVVGVTLSSQVQSISEFCFTCLFSAKHLSGSLLLCCYSSLSCLDNGNQLLNPSRPFQAPPHSLSP